MIYGYARVSSDGQDTGIQEDALRSAGAEIVRAEKVSGTSRKGRKELETLLQFLREGDVLMVTRLDRLARSLSDLSAIVDDLTKRGCSLKCTEQPVDTGSATGRAFLGMLGVFAQFETEIRKERQAEGIAKAKAKGVYRGRPADQERMVTIFDMKRKGMGATAIAKAVGVTRPYVYKVLARQMALAI